MRFGQGRSGLAGLVLAALLIGCGQASHAPPQSAVDADGVVSGGENARGRAESAAANAPAPPPMAQSSDDAQSRGLDANQRPPSQPQRPGSPAPVLYLAYAYQMALEVPASRLIGVMDAHVRACQQAGPALCQLIGSQRQGDPESAISGSVSLRAEPAWVHGFMDRIGRDAEAAGGRVSSQATTTEDLTRSIVDTEATLRADRALRDRLQHLLESRPGRLSDLLEVERELARVQGEIDATESNLAVMRTRVSMSTLTLSYESSAKAVGSDTFRPLGDAFASFLGIVVRGFAFIIELIAALLPFALVIGPIVWLLLRWRRRRGGRFFRRKEDPA